MTEHDERFERLIQGLRAADPVAMSRFVDAYGSALERLAASRLEPGVRRRVGPESIAQSVCRTFLRRAEGGEFEIADGDALWGLLCAIALTKVREKVRHHRREKRSFGREERIDGDAPVTADPAPAPEDQVLFADQFAHVVSSLSDEEQSIVNLRLQGRRQVDIAAELNVTERTVRRLMNALQERLEAAFGA